MSSSRRYQLAVGVVLLAVVGAWQWQEHRDSAKRRTGDRIERDALKTSVHMVCSKLASRLEGAAKTLEGKGGVEAPEGGLSDEGARVRVHALYGLDPSGKLQTHTFNGWLDDYTACAFPRAWEGKADGDAHYQAFSDHLIRATSQDGRELAKTLRQMHALIKQLDEQPYRRAY